MAILQLDTKNADRDLTSEVAVLTHTPSASVNTLCFAYVALGDGAKDLDGSGGDFQLRVTVGGQTIQPGAQTITFGTQVRSGIITAPFPVPVNKEVVVYVLSPNAADTDVDVTVYLYDQNAALPAAAPDAAGGLPISDAGGLDLDNNVQNQIVAYHLDHLLAADYDPASKPGVATALLNELVENDGGVARFTANALEQAPNTTTGLTLDAAYDAAKTAAQAGDAMTLTAEQVLAVADALLARSVAGCEASAAEHSLCTLILAALESAVSGTTWTIHRSNGTDTHVTKTVTKQAGASPITGVE